MQAVVMPVVAILTAEIALQMAFVTSTLLVAWTVHWHASAISPVVALATGLDLAFAASKSTVLWWSSFRSTLAASSR